MFLHQWNGRRQVTFLGNGVSDYLGFILDPSCAAAAASAILHAVARERDRWDICDLQDLDAASPLCVRPETHGMAHAVQPQYTCYRIPLPATCEEFEADLPHGLRRNLRRYREKLDRLGGVIFETTTEENSIRREFETLIELHRARWQLKEDNGMIDTASLARFHREAAANLAREGMARLYTMRLNGRAVAAVYVLRDGECAYSYLGGFDPEFEQFSVGAIALQFAIEESIREGARIYDFLRGAEEYKSKWGAVCGSTYRLLIWHDEAA